MTVTATTAKGTIVTDMTKKDMIKRVSIKKATIDTDMTGPDMIMKAMTEKVELIFKVIF